MGLIGTLLSNRYEILREIGQGGMGAVYQAKDVLLDRDVAVKLLTTTMMDPDLKTRFQREARVVAKMDHPGIVGIHDIGEHEGMVFFIMPFVVGKTLRVCLQTGALHLTEILEIGQQVSDALDYSHSMSVVHRDIKPENVMIHRETPMQVRARLMDFGLAIRTSEDRLTKGNMLLGTIAYLSPEQAKGEGIDGRSDLFSLGAILYECFSGKTPFSGDMYSILYKLAHEAPPSPRSLGVSIPQELDDLVMWCLEKDPTRRPQRASELKEALARCRALLENEEAKTVFIPAPAIRAPHAAGVLFGREKELAEIQQHFQAAEGGECRFTLIGGDLGIGKSRLLEEVERSARARKVRVLHSRFVEHDRSFPYQGFCEIIQEFFRFVPTTSTSLAARDFSDLADDLIALFPVLAEIEGLARTPSGEVRRQAADGRKTDDKTFIYELLARTFTRIVGGKPLVVLLEDLHAADMSLDALQYIVRRLNPTPTLVLGTYRTTEIDKRHPITKLLDGFKGDKRFLHLKLGPLPTNDHRAFLESLVGNSRLDDSLAREIHEATEGNPYFTRELVRSLMDSGGIVKNDTGITVLSDTTNIVSGAMPATIQEAVENRIERLSEQSREVLAVASILGKTFDYRDLETLADTVENLDDTVDQLIRDGFIEEDRQSRGDRLSFVGSVVRDVLYASLTRRRRRSLHRSHAEELERRYAKKLDQVLAQLVHHHAHGDVPEKVVEYGMKLARKSLDAFLTDDAIRAAKTVLEYLEDRDDPNPELEIEARLILAQGYRTARNIDIALKELDVAGALCSESNDARLVETAVLAAESAWEGRKIDAVRQWVERGLEAARRMQAAEGLSRLLSLRAVVANLRGEYELARVSLEEAERWRPAVRDDEGPSQPGGILTAAVGSAIQSVDPHLIKFDEEVEIVANIFETLVKTDADGNLVPNLCERWEVGDDGKRFTFFLRSGVPMHDGRPFTAEDVKNSFERAVKISAGNILPAVSTIVGVADFLNGTTNALAGIEVLSETTVRIELEEPLPIYPILLTNYTSSVFREENGRAAVGTGPFRIVEIDSGRVRLERFGAFRHGAPLVEALEFHTGLTAGDIAAGLRAGAYDAARDVSPQDVEDMVRDRRQRFKLIESPKKNIHFVLFNQHSAVAQNPALRRLLCSTIRTRDLVWQTLGRHAQPAENFIPPGVLGHDPGRRRTILSPEQVMETAERSGLTFPVPVRAAVHPIFLNRYAMLTATLFELWEELGLAVTVETPDMTSFVEKRGNNEGIDLLLARWNADYSDPDDFTYSLFHSRVGRFRNYFSSDETDQLIEEARGESRPDVRGRIYRRIEAYLTDSSILLPLFHEIDGRVVGPKVRRAVLHGTPPYVNYTELGKAEPLEMTPTARKSGGTVHVPVRSAVMDLNPASTYTVDQSLIYPAIFETLTMAADGARIVPWLASELSVEQGGRRFRFRLRKDLRFHDGRPVTARDVRYSFEQLLLNSDNQMRWLHSPIRGAKQLLERVSGELDGFRILSSSDFTIELEEPISFFPAMLTHLSAAVVPEGTSNFVGTWSEGCVGTGPFRIVRFEPGRRLELEPNPYHRFAGYPKADRLVFKLGITATEILSEFRAGRLSLAFDLQPSDVEKLRHESEFAARFREIPVLSTFYLVFNIHRGPFSDERFRRYFAQTLDVEDVVRRNLGRLAVPAHGLIPPGLLGHESKSRLKPMGTTKITPRSGDAVGMMHSLYDGTYSSFVRDLLGMFREKGVIGRMAEARTEATTVLPFESVDFLIDRWIGDYPDPDTFVKSLLHSEGGRYGSFCGTNEIDRLIERGRTETDPEIRHAIYREVDDIVQQRALIVPLFHEQAYRFARPEVEGLEINYFAPFVPYEKLWVRRE